MLAYSVTSVKYVNEVFPGGLALSRMSVLSTSLPTNMATEKNEYHFHGFYIASDVS